MSTVSAYRAIAVGSLDSFGGDVVEGVDHPP
jgi:hypothetical protein